jgi:hypothetical protein
MTSQIIMTAVIQKKLRVTIITDCYSKTLVVYHHECSTSDWLNLRDYILRGEGSQQGTSRSKATHADGFFISRCDIAPQGGIEEIAFEQSQQCGVICFENRNTDESRCPCSERNIAGCRKPNK